MYHRQFLAAGKVEIILVDGDILCNQVTINRVGILVMLPLVDQSLRR